MSPSYQSSSDASSPSDGPVTSSHVLAVSPIDIPGSSGPVDISGPSGPAIATRSLLSQSTFTGEKVREYARIGLHSKITSGLAPTFVQANLIVLPSRYADDFEQLCERNPVPCPLLAKSAHRGSYDKLKSLIYGVADDKLAANVDIRTDVPNYMVYVDGKLEKSHCDDIVKEWTEDHVAFLIGCSFSFDSALTNADYSPQHTLQGRNVPMYKTNIPLCPSGVFDQGTYVVSMRAYNERDIETVRAITRPFKSTHGEPIAWGWKAVKRLGIKDINKPDWGEPPLTAKQDLVASSLVEGDKNNVPVFWGCGVTPQQAVISAGLKGVVMAHAPGHMLVLDCRDWDIVRKK